MSLGRNILAKRAKRQLLQKFAKAHIDSYRSTTVISVEIGEGGFNLGSRFSSMIDGCHILSVFFHR